MMRLLWLVRGLVPCSVLSMDSTRVRIWIPFLQKHVKGPKWLHFFIGLPPLLLFSGASAAFGAYAVPRFAQLTVTSYYAASSASHYAISQITRYVEGANSSHDHHDKPR